jgi:hypothetical protein
LFHLKKLVFPIVLLFISFDPSLLVHINYIHYFHLQVVRPNTTLVVGLDGMNQNLGPGRVSADYMALEFLDIFSAHLRSNTDTEVIIELNSSNLLKSIAGFRLARGFQVDDLERVPQGFNPAVAPVLNGMNGDLGAGSVDAGGDTPEFLNYLSRLDVNDHVVLVNGEMNIEQGRSAVQDPGPKGKFAVFLQQRSVPILNRLVVGGKIESGDRSPRKDEPGIRRERIRLEF